MKCDVIGCLVDHDPVIIDEHNIWKIYESYSPEFKVVILKRWIKLYSDVDSDFARTVVSKCQFFLKEFQE